MQRFQDGRGRWWRAEYEPPGGGIGSSLENMPELPRLRGRIVFRAEDDGEIRERDTVETFGLAVAGGAADEAALRSALATSSARR